MTNRPRRVSEPALPPALSGERHEFDGAAGRLSYYVSQPALHPAARPLLLIHSVNAAATAFEVKPVYEHFASLRPVYALDLPGFGFSERSERAYTLRLMTDAVLSMQREIERLHGSACEGGIDALAVSLGCEYLARAASEQPAAFRRVALVSPTGFNRRKPSTGTSGSHRGMGWLYDTFTAPFWTEGIYRTLTRPGVIRFFLEKTWGSKAIDEGLLAYDVLTTRQPGARHAPLRFVSGFLFAGDITRVYESLRQPVWMVHGIRGDFTDYRYKATLAGRPNWIFNVMQTGALPFFEQPAEFNAACAAFLDGAEASR